MQFLKKHYEKVILSIVLLGLAVAAAALPLKVTAVKDYLEQTVTGFVRATSKPYKSVDLSTNRAVVTRLHTPQNIELSGTHNLVNPVVWKKMPDSSVVKIQSDKDFGPGALIVNRIEELQLVVVFEGVSLPRYEFSVLRETDTRPAKAQRSVTVGTKNNLFKLIRVDGPPENPTAALIQMDGEKDPILVLRDKPFQRVIGYAADLSNTLGSKQTFARKKVGDTLKLEGDSETYKIVAIDQNEVVLSANSTQKRWKLKANPGQISNASNPAP